MKRFGILLLILFTLTGCTSKSSFGEYEVIIREDSLYFINGTENYEEEGYNFHSVQKTLHVKDDFIYQIDTRYLLEENNATLKKYDSVLDLIEDTENIDYQYITIDKGGDLFEIETFSYFKRKCLWMYV